MPVGLIESLDHEARGITRLEGKAIFVEGALPGELVEYSSFRRKPTYEQAVAERIISPSSQRVEPRCPHFGTCGGCSMQHLGLSAQVAAKQRVLEDSLWHIGRLRAGQLLTPIHGEPWGYRNRARLSIRNVPAKGGVLVGFHERRSSYVADIKECPVLAAEAAALLLPLRELIARLSIRDRVPQVEVAKGTQGLALAFCVLAAPSQADLGLFKKFAQVHELAAIYIQPGGPATLNRVWPTRDAVDISPGEELSYALPEFDLEMRFSPTEFTQVNHQVNEVMVRRALALLRPEEGERVADMFCGLGNFALPIARSGASVLGIEAAAGLIQRARTNARLNGLSDLAEFAVANLFDCNADKLAAYGRFDKMLIDPPREGAIELVKALPARGAPFRIVYVSCDPATLARDAAVLVAVQGYRLSGAGVVNMFPHTSHVESIAVFER